MLARQREALRLRHSLDDGHGVRRQSARTPCVPRAEFLGGEVGLVVLRLSRHGQREQDDEHARVERA